MQGTTKRLLKEERMQREFELAWAAGFFDGEGYIGITLDRRWLKLSLSINQVDREVLDRFNSATGDLGKIYGPNTYRTSSGSRLKPQYKLQVIRHKNIQIVFDLLLPYLSGVKRRQGMEAIRRFNEKAPN